ncbi:MAG: DUF445 family protein [Firmicutes bacterium]|jgi:uncharacterized membrane protein YheB (UPF0754 family)|nr:DUF445 family protein [Bacillota bacterium]MDD3298923.1 DUF445 family protein [Bacillota bacterium]MDD3851234.1 DUF445 family protein [Bacillota bacterium]MDD4707092.1 DUF445 family protein [Bacillota bacterium]
MLLKFAFMGLVGAGIGWFTNRIAIRMLFRPQTPIRIPVIGLTIQGLIPRRRREIAGSIGEVVDRELVSIEEIVLSLAAEKNREEIIEAIKEKVEDITKSSLPGLIPVYIKELIADYINDIVDEQANMVINELVENIIHKAAMEMNLRQMIEDKINQFDLGKLEDIILSVADRELKHIEYLGAAIGFVIGLAQATLVYLVL